MLLTIEEKKERNRIYNKKYREENRERIVQREKKYREENKEKIKEKKKKYYENNREKIKEHRQDNRQIINERTKKYSQTPNGIKSRIIKNWKRHGLQHDDMSALYDQYINTTNCEDCGIEFGVFGDGSGTFKCMDHDHETNLFRNFLCSKCNIKRG